MIEMHSKYDNMHINVMFYALFCINNHVYHVKIACYHHVTPLLSEDQQPRFFARSDAPQAATSPPRLTVDYDAI